MATENRGGPREGSGRPKGRAQPQLHLGAKGKRNRVFVNLTDAEYNRLVRRAKGRYLAQVLYDIAIRGGL